MDRGGIALLEAGMEGGDGCVRLFPGGTNGIGQFINAETGSGEDDDECSCDTNVTNKIANLNEENKKR